MNLGNWCAECGADEAGPRQICATCEDLYPIANDDAAGFYGTQGLVTDECLCGCNHGNLL